MKTVILKATGHTMMSILSKKNRIISLLIMFCFILGTGICFGDRNSSEFEFTRDYIESLRLLRKSIDRHIKSGPDNVDYQSDVDMVMVFMENFRLDNDDLKRAKERIDEYADSENKLIEETSLSILNIYDRLIKINGQSLELYKKLYSPELLNNPNKINQGLFMSDAGKLAADRKQAEEMLLEASSLFTITLVSDTPDKHGFLSYLAVDSSERKELVELIDEIFGTSLKATYIDSCGAAIRQVLVSDRSSADER